MGEEKVPHRQPVPLVLWAYLGITVLLVLMSFLPSEIDSGYTWQGALLEIVLLLGLFFGSAACRIILIIIGLALAFGTLLTQTAPLDFVATVWSLVALLGTGLLVTPAARHFTGGSRRSERSSESLT